MLSCIFSNFYPHQKSSLKTPLCKISNCQYSSVSEHKAQLLSLPAMTDPFLARCMCFHQAFNAIWFGLRTCQALRKLIVSPKPSQKFLWRAGIVTKWIKPANCDTNISYGTSLSTGYSTFNSASCQWPGKSSGRWLVDLGPCHPHRRSGWSS